MPVSQTLSKSDKSSLWQLVPLRFDRVFCSHGFYRFVHYSCYVWLHGLARPSNSSIQLAACCFYKWTLPVTCEIAEKNPFVCNYSMEEAPMFCRYRFVYVCYVSRRYSNVLSWWLGLTRLGKPYDSIYSTEGMRLLSKFGVPRRTLSPSRRNQRTFCITNPKEPWSSECRCLE